MHRFMKARAAIYGFALAPLLAGGIALASAAHAQDQSLPGGFTPEQADGMQQIIRQYLLENPEVLVEALTEYQRRQEVAEQQRLQQAVVDSRAALRDDPDAPVLGNPEGDVVIVEFFDYRCPYCRRAAESVQELVAEDGGIRLVMKEWPILGPESVTASRMALAVARLAPEKYEAFHFAAMSLPRGMDQDDLDRVARGLDLDLERIKADMQSPAIGQALGRTMTLARSLGITGTPAFVIGDTLVPGMIDTDTMRRLVAEARANSS